MAFPGDGTKADRSPKLQPIEEGTELALPDNHKTPPAAMSANEVAHSPTAGVAAMHKEKKPYFA